MRLARRLDGLPLALATAGAYLSQSADSFDDYLQLYNHSWDDLSQYSSGPVDYEERTLYSTWSVSFEQIRDQDPAAAEVLKLMAYLNNQDLWYGLFQGGVDDAPAWWVDVLKDPCDSSPARHHMLCGLCRVSIDNPQATSDLWTSASGVLSVNANQPLCNLMRQQTWGWNMTDYHS